MYFTESAQWKAYQFSDPFSSNSFCVCNKMSSVFCRPDCDARPITTLKSEVKFVPSAQEALSLGFHPCESCDPVNAPVVDVGLLIKCVASINDQLGFCPPLLDDNEERNNQQIKRTILEGARAHGGEVKRRMSMSSYGDRDLESTSLSKNDSDHYRLVDLACRHLALAAAMNYFHIPSPRPSPASPDDGKDGRKRRRRGGVLGFKELAAKSKLSAWHFHRVFKSVTGLTPKTYGDKCWDFFKNYRADESSPVPSRMAPIAAPPLYDVDSVSASPESPRKRVKLEPHPMHLAQPSMVFGQVDGAMLFAAPEMPAPSASSASLASSTASIPAPEPSDLDHMASYQFPTSRHFDLNLSDNLMLFPSEHSRSASMPEADTQAALDSSPMMAMAAPPQPMGDLPSVQVPLMDEFSMDMFSLDPVSMEVPDLDDFNPNIAMGFPELTTFTS
ncbi:hypothetical protein DIURU_002568 [Diutina rugosa]|uniref:Ada DNA repair metal-binding domain-containing protein n=1 Tax=Diutina rugosa TaxID=5481 RepID=A0A642UPW9_DIURU|nr:uncharacterized protein DIURU_002568 [Diutina rugosa]KAA8903140.1 hypothetical protein DIURU_002568 [Diutina rugosa]